MGLDFDSPAKPFVSPLRLVQCKVLYEYFPENDDELELKPGGLNSSP
jgi:hypothetical protein